MGDEEKHDQDVQFIGPGQEDMPGCWSSLEEKKMISNGL